MMSVSVLIVGNNARAIACSAHRAGYKVYSISHYDDRDLSQCVDKSFTFIGNQLTDIKHWLDIMDPDFVVLGSGFEDFNLPASMVLGNDPKISRDIINKVWMADKLKKIGIPHPLIYNNKNNIVYPCIAKPIRGGGGEKNFLVRNESMLPKNDDYFFQKFIEGKPLSVSILSTGTQAEPIALNEIMVGKKWLGQYNEFGYCGNVTPYKTKFKDRMYEIAKELILALGLIGYNGIDFIVNKDGPLVLEINPRFTGAIDSIELAAKENIFKAHVNAINGKLDEYKIKEYGIKSILFAHRPTIITGDLQKPMLADVPRIGSLHVRGKAICSILGSGITRDNAFGRLMERIRFVKKNLKGSQI